MAIFAIAACSDREAESPFEVIVLHEEIVVYSVDADCPGCGERRPNGDELADIQRIIGRMDSCPGIQDALEDRLHNMWIFTDSAEMAQNGGVFVGYQGGSSKIFISQAHWDLTGNDFDAALFGTLKHEGRHEEMWREESFDPDNWHNDSFWADVNVCHAN